MNFLFFMGVDRLHHVKYKNNEWKNVCKSFACM